MSKNDSNAAGQEVGTASVLPTFARLEALHAKEYALDARGDRARQLRAFELGALDYLLKPIHDERFAEAINRARRSLGRASKETQVDRFTIRIGARMCFVDVDDLVWIEADGDYVALHASGHRYLLRESLYQLSHKLDSTRFLRVHRCAIVRVDQIAELMPRANRDAILRLRDGTTLRASRTYVDALLAALSLSAATSEPFAHHR